MKKTILITGATDLVGGNLTAEILERDQQSKIMLLVRGTSEDQGRRRVLETLRTFLPGLASDRIQERLTILLGDTTQPGLGLTESELTNVAGRVTQTGRSRPFWRWVSESCTC